MHSRGLQLRTKVTVPGASSSAGPAERRKRLKPKLPKDKFAALTATFFERVETAVAPLQPPMNSDFVLEKDTKGVLTIRANAKEFEIKMVPLKQQLHFTSPISGLRAYEWNARTQRWEDENDSHDIEGLLTRDLMRICSGIPSF
uniref:Uncharacterized protein n=1 Tax=Globisporangium ultimum (strain ATCC 200006 / CBS 805.95 / DAOM BR144) TaxID=431595 RepID=K3XBZ4_GLOUD